jgi:PTH1 family peptidyl-tRNA hydrolase
MFLIVGLGNPGKRYAPTRHNIGYRVIDELAARSGIRLARKFRLKSEIGRGKLLGHDVLLLKPRTFMNLSGRAVSASARYYRVSITDLIVVTDDASLPVGRIRVRPRGSSGGHKGLVSLIAGMGGEDFRRVRVGIGAGEEMVAHVLGEFSTPERAAMERAVESAADAVESVVSEGTERAMDRFNGPA